MSVPDENRGPGAGNAFSWRFVTPLLLGSALNPVNSSLIATALVPIAAAMHIPVGRTAVLVSALYLATAIGQPTAGKLSEVFGPRRVFLGGILAVLAGGLVGGLGSDLTTLIVARVLIGIGTSTAYPSAMLLVRGRATQAGLDAPPGGVLGGLVIAGMVTPALGLPIGGILVQALGWQSTFLINIPLALITLVMALIWIPRDPRSGQPRTAREVVARIDLAGIVGFGGTLAALLVFLMGLPHPDWIALAAGIVLGAALVGWELRASGPFFDVRLLARNLALTRTYLRFAIISLCVYTVLYGVTQWLQAGRGLSALDTGLILLPMSALGGVIARPVSQRNLLRAPLVIAAVACLAGAAGVLLLRMSTPVVWIVIITLVFGVTLGTGVSANQTALYTQVPAGQIGTASGMFRAWGYIGSIASSAIISISFHASVGDHGLHAIALIMVAVSMVLLFFTVGDRRLMTLARPGRTEGPASLRTGQANRTAAIAEKNTQPYRDARHHRGVHPSARQQQETYSSKEHQA
jgi:MFS family permease